MWFSLRLIATCSALAIAALPALPAGAQDSCDEMQVYLSISPKHRDNVMDYIAPRLQEMHGVELVSEEIGSAIMIQRVTAQGDSPRVTIAHWDVPVGLQACNQGLCNPIDVERAPNVEKLYDWGVTRNDAGEPVVLATNAVGVGLLYRTDLFEQNDLAPPTSWTDLERDDLKGRVSITHPTSTWGTAGLVMLARLNGGGEEAIDPGFAAVKEIMPYVNTVHTWSSELSNLMQLGEVWLGTTGSNLGPTLRAEGLPVEWIAPEEGSPAVGGGVSLVKGAPCQEVAHDYFDIYYSDEFQALRMSDGGISSASKTAWDAVSEEVRAHPSLGPEEFEKLVHLDWTTINQVREDWIKRWQREIR